MEGAGFPGDGEMVKEGMGVERGMVAPTVTSLPGERPAVALISSAALTMVSVLRGEAGFTEVTAAGRLGLV